MANVAGFNASPINGFAPLTVQFTDTSYGVAGDPLYIYVTVLAHLDGSNGGTTFTDNSSYHTAMSIAAGTVTTSNAQKKFGTASAYFPDNSGTSGSIDIANPSNRFVLQDDFTIECWVYRTPASWNSNATILRKDFSTTGGYWLLRIQADGKYHFSGSGPSGDVDLVTTIDASTYDNHWVNLCVTRQGNILYFFINGTLNVVTSFSGFIGSDNAYVDGGTMRISQPTSGEWWTGYVDEVRITKGQCRYTGNYTVATQPFPNTTGDSNPPIPIYWYYEFGDGSGNTSQNPNQTFYSPGTFTVNETVNFSDGSHATAPPKNITVTANPATGSFSYIPTSPVANSVIVFTDTSTSTLPGKPTDWLWEFSIGNSTQQNPQFSFPAAGSWAVRLTVSGPDFGNASTAWVSIPVSRDKPFSFASPWCGMQFFDNDGLPLSYGIISVYQQNGFTPATMYEDNWSQNTFPSITQLDQNGRWIATQHGEWYGMNISQPQTTFYNMVATEENGTTVTQVLNNSNTQQLYSGGKNVTVTQDDPYTNVFYIRSSSADPFHDQGRTYMWYATSTTPISSSGNPSNPDSYVVVQQSESTSKDEVSYQPGVGYIFHRNGAYLIETETIWDAAPQEEVDVGIRGRIIQVNGEFGHADQTYTSTYRQPIYKPLTVFDSYTFAATKDDVINIFHFYNSSESSDLGMRMIVRITRYGPKFIQDRAPAISAFTTNPTNPSEEAPVTVTFLDASTGNPNSWLWDFGDGFTATTQNAIHTYTTGGTFIPTLTASNLIGTNGPVSGDPITITLPPPLVQWILTFQDDTGTTLPISQIANDPYADTDVSALINQLDGLMWTRNDNTTPAFFNKPPQPQSTNNVVAGDRDYFFQDNQYSYGRWLYLIINPYTSGTIALFSFSVNLTDNASVNTEDRTFHANAGQTIVCCTQGLTGTECTGDSYIRLLDNTGTELTFNDDCGDLPNYLASYLVWTAVYTGDYTIKIGAFSLSAASGIAGYQVT